MTFLWIALLPGVVTAAWIRYRFVVKRGAATSIEKPFLSQPTPPRPWGAHSHQQGVRWLHEIFERSAQRFPQLPALSVPERGEVLTYAELDRLATDLAGTLSEYVNGNDQIVAVRMHQDNATIVALHLAILKAGAVQLFIDPESPDALLEQILIDAEPALLITDSPPAHYAGTVVSPTVLREMTPARARSALPAPPSACAHDRLASVFYTSGTTGTPKGVECPHAGYINLAQSYATFYDFVPGSDASSLTSSLGYDGSISEMYSAWVAGCEVVLLSKSALRSGPDLIPLLRQSRVTALFCPPVLLTTLTQQPEIDLPYPICRYIVPAGEAFPASLVEPWSRARRQIVNTYGPTEVSTDTSRQLLRPNEPVTIGSPFPGVEYYILDPETLALLPHDTEGELCIGGIQLARGYRKRPEITSSRFIDHPLLGRLYRSGDRCHVDASSLRVHFHGRIDAQLKVRGYRVEAQPIESLLQDEFPEIETAVLDVQQDELVALLRAPALLPGTNAERVAALAHPLVERAQALIAERFPPYAVPSRFFGVDRFELMPASGKINRRALPQIEIADVIAYSKGHNNSPASETPGGARESAVLSLCRSELGASLGWHDDFVDWGAHSIAIARLTQKLQAEGYPVSVRALLSDTRSAAAIAALTPIAASSQQKFSAQSAAASENARAIPSRQFGFNAFSALQALGAVFLRVPLLLMAALGLAVIDPEELLLAGEVVSFLWATVLAYAMYVLVPFVNLGWVKFLRALQRQLAMSPSLSPGHYRKFSSHHLQLWWIEQQADFVLKPLVNGLRSPILFNWALAQLGGKIHPGAFIAQSTEWYGPLSLISIGEGAVIQAGAQLSSVRWQGDTFVLDTIRIDEKARVGARALVGGGASLGRAAWLTPLSSLDTQAAERTQVSGVPGRVVGGYQRPRTPATKTVARTAALLLDARNVLVQLLLELALIIIPGGFISLIATYFLGFDALSKVNLDAGLLTFSDILRMVVAGVAGIWLGVLTSSLILCFFLRATPTPHGWIPATSFIGTLARYRQTKMNQIQQMWGWSLTGQYLRALAGVRFSTVGASECDALVNLLPEQLDADANVFIAQGCYCNVLDEHGEYLLAQPVQLPAGFFGSNNAMIESGSVPGNLLLGVSTPIGPYLYRPQYTDRPDQQRTLAGNPPLELRNVNPVASPVHPSPSLAIFIARFILNDLASVGIIPGITVFLATFLLVYLNIAGFSNIEAALLTSTIVPMCLPLLALGVKLLLVGNRWGTDHRAPFWSIRHFTYFLAQDCFFRLMTGFMGAVSGTALANPILRRFGCKIGRRSLIGLPLQLSDWHAVDIGDDCVINGQMQLHSFEDRILTVARSTIGSGTAINHGTMLMGGATLEPGVTVESQSLVLKAMTLKRGVHAGSPAQPVAAG